VQSVGAHRRGVPGHSMRRFRERSGRQHLRGRMASLVGDRACLLEGSRPDARSAWWNARWNSVMVERIARGPSIAHRVGTALLAVMALQFAYRALTARPGFDTPTGTAWSAWQRSPDRDTEAAWQAALAAPLDH